MMFYHGEIVLKVSEPFRLQESTLVFESPLFETPGFRFDVRFTAKNNGMKEVAIVYTVYDRKNKKYVDRERRFVTGERMIFSQELRIDCSRPLTIDGVPYWLEAGLPRR